MKKSLPRTIGFAIAALLFFVFAGFQVNDLDPEVYYKPSHLDATLWFGFYLLIGILFIIAIWKKIPTWLLVLAVIACLVEMITTGPGLWQNVFGDKAFDIGKAGMSAQDPRIELSREFFGAVIALAGVIVLWRV